MENRNFENAIQNYEASLNSNFKDDSHTLNKLVICYFYIEDFDKVIAYSNKINLDRDFKKTVYYYGLALEKKGNLEDAEIQLRKVDKRYSNYPERLAFSEFYIRNNKKEKAKELLQEIVNELKSMSKDNYRKHSALYNEANNKLNEM